MDEKYLQMIGDQFKTDFKARGYEMVRPPVLEEREGIPTYTALFKGGPNDQLFACEIQAPKLGTALRETARRVDFRVQEGGLEGIEGAFKGMVAGNLTTAEAAEQATSFLRLSVPKRQKPSKIEEWMRRSMI